MSVEFFACIIFDSDPSSRRLMFSVWRTTSNDAIRTATNTSGHNCARFHGESKIRIDSSKSMGKLIAARMDDNETVRQIKSVIPQIANTPIPQRV